MQLSKQHIASIAAGSFLTLSLGAGALAFADSFSGLAQTRPGGAPGVAGTVTAVSGNTVTVTGKDGVSYTVDATGAAITKSVSVGVSDIQVGDMLAVRGTVNGSSVAATDIHDGKLPEGGFAHGGMPAGGKGVRGTVESINGSTLTVAVTNPKDSTTSTYTVDASGAEVLKGDGTGKPASSTLSAIATGDTVMVAGEINGSAVTAKVIVDGPLPAHPFGKGPQKL